MRYKYMNIDTRAAGGILAAERLKAAGWRVVCAGLWIVTFEKTY
jgi:hypothetical protein